MNIETYKARRALLNRQEASRGRKICWTCRRPVVGCFCGEVIPFATKAHFVILMHPMEARREKSGTGCLAAACLKQGQLISGIDFTHHDAVNELLEDDRYYPMLLYPGKDAFNLSNHSLAQRNLPREKQLLIFIVDGTWTCARKMMRLSRNLQALPRLCFTPNQQSEFSIKHQPHESCLSTIESIHCLLEEMDRDGFDLLNGAHDNLLHVFRSMVDFQVQCAADPNRSGYRRKPSFKPKEQRKASIKHQKRNVFFESRP